MKPHECLFFSRHTAMGSLAKALDYLSCYLPSTFHHPFKMDDKDLLVFLHGALQIYLEYWNSSCPFEEYMPDFMKQSHSVHEECQHIITETMSLLKHIRSCQFLSNVNTVEAMDELHKLNVDFIAILHEYFKTTIWSENAVQF